MQKNSELLVVGKIIGFHGLKGELKLTPYADYPERFNELESVFIDGKNYKIKSSRILKGKAYITLEGIESRTEAEKYRDHFVEIKKNQSPEPEEDEFFIVDLLNLPVYDETGQIGILKDILQTTGSVNTFVIETDEKTIYVPALKEYFSVDEDKKKVFAKIPEEYFSL